MTAFHRDAPPAARRSWLLALPAAYLLVYVPLLVLGTTGNSAWLPDFSGLYCVLVALACLAHAPRAWSRRAAWSGGRSLALLLLAADAGAYRVFSIADYVHDPHLIKVCLAELLILAAAAALVAPDAGRAAAMPQPHHLRSPLILQDVRVQPLTPAGSCPPGYAASPGQCYGRATGRPVTITSAGVSPVSQFRPPTPSGQPAPPAEYGFWITVPAADVKALATVIPAPAGPPGQLTARPVPASAGVPAIRVAGRTWVLVGFSRQPSGRALKVFLLSQDQAAQLQGILAASG